jgi:hypothetical protein
MKHQHLDSSPQIRVTMKDPTETAAVAAHALALLPAGFACHSSTTHSAFRALRLVTFFKAINPHFRQ